MKIKEVIIILGMHRSGTSLVSGIFNSLGYSVGKNQWKPDTNNIKGYFENSSIVDFNDKVLDKLNKGWDNLYSNGLTNEDVDYLSQEKTILKRIINEEFGEFENIVIKDPRISILLPFYNLTFKELNISPRFVIVFRDPVEVAASLSKRDNFSYSHSFQLWLHYNYFAELHSRDYIRVIVDYGAFLKTPFDIVIRICKQLGLKKGLDSINKKVISEFVDPKLNRSKLIERQVETPTLVKSLYVFLNSVPFDSIDNQDFKSKMNQYRNVYLENFNLFNDNISDLSIHIQLKDEEGDIHSIKRSLALHNNVFRIDVNEPKMLKSISLVLGSRNLVMKIDKMEFVDEEKQIIEPDSIINNAEYISEDQHMFFYTHAPKIESHFYKTIKICKISLDVDIISYGKSSIFQLVKEIKKQSIRIQNIPALEPKIDLIATEIKESKLLENEIRGYEKKLSLKSKEAQRLRENERKYQADIEILNQKFVLQKEQISNYREELKKLKNDLENKEREHKSQLENRTEKLNDILHQFNKVEKNYQKSLLEKRNSIEKLSGILESTKTEAKNKESLKDGKIQELSIRIKNSKEKLKLLNDLINKREKQLKSEKLRLQKQFEIQKRNYILILSEKNKDLSLTKSSLTWRVGRFMLYPFILANKILSRK